MVLCVITERVNEIKGENHTGPRKLTFRGMVICLLILAPVTYGLISYKKVQRQKYQDLCVGTFMNLGQAFALYRADFDDRMPIEGPSNKEQVHEILEKYAGGKPIDCPSGPDKYLFRTAAKDPARPTEWYFIGGHDDSVIASCVAHTSNGVGLNPKIPPFFYTAVSGKMNILFRSGSVKSVSSLQDGKSWYLDKGLIKEVPFPDTKGVGRYAIAYTFQFEPEPEFEK